MSGNVLHVRMVDIMRAISESGRYVNDRTTDYCLAEVPAIPYLFDRITDGMPLTWEHCVQALTDHPLAIKRDPEQTRRRAAKLAQDFLRELHTFTLLQPHFPVLHYAAHNDFAGVDFKAQIPADWHVQTEIIGIDCRIRAFTPVDVYTELKEARRRARKEPDIELRVFVLDQDYGLNEDYGVWTFTPDAVAAFVGAVRNRLAADEPAGVEVRK